MRELISTLKKHRRGINIGTFSQNLCKRGNSHHHRRHNPPNSDMDYRIFNLRAGVNACDCTRGCTDTERGSALKVDSGRKILCHTGELNLRQRRAGPMIYQLGYIPIPVSKIKTHEQFRFFFFQGTNKRLFYIATTKKKRKKRLNVWYYATSGFYERRYKNEEMKKERKLW